MFTPGLCLHDRYALVERIGLGGMSEVWRAVDEVLGRHVAVKALAPPPDRPLGPPSLSPDRAGPPTVPPPLATRREAMAAARLTHPNVTQVYDYGEAALPGGVLVPYLVMELVDGQNLAERLSHGPLPWPAAARVAAQVAAGLAAAHRLGVVHLDVKPGNVMLTAAGAKILDFGISALIGARPEHDGGWLIGTPAYIAPERLRPGGADPSADVYGLGALLYESLTGRPPIVIGRWEEAAAAHQRATPVPAPHAPALPAAVSALCLACISPNPADRPEAAQVAAGLHAALGGAADGPEPVAATPAASPGGASGVPAPAVVGPAAASPLHPPTLIDRSLTSLASARPPVAAQSPADARIAASAAVPRRGADAGWGEEPPLTSGAPSRSRLALVGVIGGIVAVGLALLLVAAAFRSDVANTSASSATSAPASAAAPSTDAAPTPANPPSTNAEILDRLDAVIAELVSTGQLREDVAQDLRDGLRDLRGRSGDGKRKDLRKKAQDLSDKIDERLQEGSLTEETAYQLQTLLAPLLATGGGNRDGG